MRLIKNLEKFKQKVNQKGIEKFNIQNITGVYEIDNKHLIIIEDVENSNKTKDLSLKRICDVWDSLPNRKSVIIKVQTPENELVTLADCIIKKIYNDIKGDFKTVLDYLRYYADVQNVTKIKGI